VRYRVQFPRDDVKELGQDEVFFYLLDEDGKERIRLHDYCHIYQRPGLYEQVVYERLKCQSPQKVVDVLSYALDQTGERASELRVLDLGAGNGIVGERLNERGIARLVGIDIEPEARTAAYRDRPGVYDDYYVVDLCNLSDQAYDDLRSWSLDCLVTVAALGFADVPAEAFMVAYNLVREDGWIAFNIKETFLDRSDDTGFSKLIRELILSEHLDLHRLERYRHRYSMDGVPLHYFALSARKRRDVPREFLDSVGVSCRAR
jgi:SAM-dependent methyltransferase